MNTSDGLAAGDAVRYYCNPGYMLVGEAERICLTDSQWNGNSPTCAVGNGVKLFSANMFIYKSEHKVLKNDDENNNDDDENDDDDDDRNV